MGPIWQARELLDDYVNVPGATLIVLAYAFSGAASIMFDTRRLYAKLFPAYVDDRALSTVDQGVRGRWLNLWRNTDPIGGPVGEPARDRYLVDPAGFPVAPGDTASCTSRAADTVSADG